MTRLFLPFRTSYVQYSTWSKWFAAEAPKQGRCSFEGLPALAALCALELDEEKQGLGLWGHGNSEARDESEAGDNRQRLDFLTITIPSRSGSFQGRNLTRCVFPLYTCSHAPTDAEQPHPRRLVLRFQGSFCSLCLGVICSEKKTAWRDMDRKGPFTESGDSRLFFLNN